MRRQTMQDRKSFWQLVAIMTLLALARVQEVVGMWVQWPGYYITWTLNTMAALAAGVWLCWRVKVWRD